MSKQRQAFEKEYNKHHPNDMATRLQNGNYSGWVKQASWEMWQQAQKLAVPDTTAVVLALENVQTEVSHSSFVTMDVDNESEIYAVDATKLSKYIDDLIEAVDQPV